MMKMRILNAYVGEYNMVTDAGYSEGYCRTEVAVKMEKTTSA